METFYPILVSLKTHSPGSHYTNILQAIQGIKFIITGGILRRRDPKPNPEPPICVTETQHTLGM